MSTCKSLQSYKGRGSVSLALRASDGSLSPWFKVAEARLLDLGIEQDFEDQYSRCDPASGQIIHALNQTDVNMSLDTFDFSPEMLEKGLYGTLSEVAGTAITNESLAFTAVGQTLPLAHPFGISAISSGILVEDTDYSVDTDHGLVTSITITSSEDFDYTYVTYDKVEGLLQSVREYAIRYDGYNINDADSAVQVTLHRVALNASSNLSLITDETAVVSLTGKLLSDQTKGTGLSKYFVVKTIA